jgi:hypothetical protein
LVNWTVAVDLDEQPAGVVNTDERFGLLVVNVKPVPDDSIIVITSALLGRSPPKPVNSFAGLSNEFDHNIECRSMASEKFVEFANLIDRAGVAIEKEAISRIILGESMAHERIGEGVRHIVPGIHVHLCLLAQICLRLHDLPEDIAGRDRRDVVFGRESACLSALARSWRSDQKDSSNLLGLAKAQRRRPS